MLLFWEVGTVALCEPLCEPLRCSLPFVAALDPWRAACAARVPSFQELPAGPLRNHHQAVARAGSSTRSWSRSRCPTCAFSTVPA